MNAPTLTPPPVGESLVMRRRYAASPQRVFDAWTKADLLRQWFRPTDRHETFIAETDPRVGGQYRIGMRLPEGAVVKPGEACEDHGGERQWIVSGTYHDVQPHKKLIFTWQWQSGTDSGHGTLVTLNFEPTSDGGTELTLTHERLPSAKSKASHEHGWSGCLDHLGQLVD